MTKEAATVVVRRIEKNVPLPAYTKMPGSSSFSFIDSLKRLKAGESFLTDMEANAKTLNIIRSRVEHVRKTNDLMDRKYTCNKSTKEEDGELIRIWRKE